MRTPSSLAGRAAAHLFIAAVSLLTLTFAPAAYAAELSCGHCAELMGEGTAASAAAGASASASAALVPDPLEYVAPSRSFRTVHTSLDLDVDLHAQTIAGSVTHTMESLRDAPGELSLNAVGLDISRVTIDGAPARFDYPVAGIYDTAWLTYSNAAASGSLLVVYPPAALARSQQFALTIEYTAAPRQGLYFITPEAGNPKSRPEVWSQGQGENNRYWIPLFDYPNDRSTFDGTYRVAKPYTVLSNGHLDAVTDLPDGRREFHWVMEQPLVSYLIMLAAGEYDIHRDDWRGKELAYYVPPGTPADQVERAFGETIGMLDFFSDVIGVEYPYDTYSQVVVQNFIYGGMENTTATVLNDRALYSASAALTRTAEDLIAHELAHQWWGDMVPLREWSQMWLNEGFATYFQQLYTEHRRGADEFMYDLDGAHRATIDADANDPRPLVVDFHNRRDATNSSNVYVKGASVLHMLRRHFGDELFFAAINRYATEMQWRNSETADLARAFRETSGENVDWFFEQWVYLSGHPRLKASKQWDSARGQLTLKIEQQQQVSEQVPIFRLPLDIEITTASGPQMFKVVSDSASEEFYFALPSEPLMVLIDKGGHTLLELEFERSLGELEYQLKHADTYGRLEAIRQLGKLSGNRDAAALLRDALLADGFWGLGKSAATALRGSGTDIAQQALYDGLSHSNARVRHAVAQNLRDMPLTAQLEEKLVALHKGDPADAVRAEALTALSALKSGHAVELALAALGTTSDRESIRSSALAVLQEQEHIAALDQVAALARVGNSRAYRHNAIDTYAFLASKHKDDAVRQEAARFLAGMLDDWYTNTRTNVIGALDTLKHKDALAALRQVASHDRVERVRRRATEAAASIESYQPDELKLEELAGELSSVKDELARLKEELAELQRKLPEVPE